MIKAKYIESGTFVTSEEEVYNEGIARNEEVILLTKQEFNSLLVALQESQVGFREIEAFLKTLNLWTP